MVMMLTFKEFIRLKEYVNGGGEADSENKAKNRSGDLIGLGSWGGSAGDGLKVKVARSIECYHPESGWQPSLPPRSAPECFGAYIEKRGVVGVWREIESIQINAS